MRKVSSVRAGQPKVVSITVRGKTLVVLNDLKRLAFQYNVDTIIDDATWLVDQLWIDCHTPDDGAIDVNTENGAHTGACGEDVEPSDDNGNPSIDDEYEEEIDALKQKTTALFWSPSRNAYIAAHDKVKNTFTIRYCKRVLGNNSVLAEMQLQRSRAEAFIESGTISPIVDSADGPHAISLPTVRSSSSTIHRVVKRSRYSTGNMHGAAD